MPKNINYFLNKMLGEDFLEVLGKTEIYKLGTRTTLDTSDIHLGLKLAPRTIMSFLVKELSPMQIGEQKDIKLPVEGDASLHVDKMERDCFNGQIFQNNKKIAEFLSRSIPGIGLYLLSTFELYDVENLAKENELDSNKQIQQMIDERVSLHDLINKVVDKKMLEREAVNELLLAKLTEALEKEKNESERERIRLAGCACAAQGMNVDDVSPEYVSASLNDVKDLRQKYDKLVESGAVMKKESNLVETQKKGSPLKDFLEKREKKTSTKEFNIQMAKGETVCCPDCGKEIFSEEAYSGCVCMGQDMDNKIFIKKTEDGVKIRFPKSWDVENIEMLLEVLRGNHGQ